MITAGLDIGAGSTKGVLLEDAKRLVQTAIEPTRGSPAKAARAALERLVEAANLLPGEVDYVCTTGFGRYAYPERHLQVSDITSSARGAIFLYPRSRLVVDIGSQSSRAIAVAPTGRVEKFKMNEKCAAGAGRFVERCAKYLQVPLEELGPRAMESSKPMTISSVCAVLAETEIINNFAEGVPLPDILMGVFVSLAQRAHTLMRYVGVNPEVTLVGGLVHNPGMVSALRQAGSLPVNASSDGHFAAAIGAATLAQARLTKLRAAGGEPGGAA